ncbi:MAG: Gfo/Idh/MocA family oxidoreductase [Candidatus Hydrogenedentes bacterium]|jgi:predicted dehydrogenase|nr:Gfo/Idh/MocA family oxidoreductase [Candidatus Hydrogenedentota bacterium]
MKLRHKSVSRRQFLAACARTAALGTTVTSLYAPRAHSALSMARRVPPSEQIRLAVIGTGGMGRRHIEALSENPQCSLAAVCDVATGRFKPVLEWLKKERNIEPDGYQDFRHILDRKDIDAVLVATPDHWHPMLTILGCQAGKDVYVEKPAATTVAEGRAMVEAARRYGRVVQLGTQQRTMPLFQTAMTRIHRGDIGKVTAASVWVGQNVWQTGETRQEVPRGLDWDLWLGPAPKVPFSMERYTGWMGWHDYARGGQFTNWGVHLLDIVHWGIGQDRPLSVQASGGSFTKEIGQDNYEILTALYEYPGCLVSWEQRPSDFREGKSYGICFYGEEGALSVDRASLVIRRNEQVKEELVGEPEESWAHPPHHNDFFASIRSRSRPAADIEQGVRSTNAPLLGGIALKTRRKLYWDGDQELFRNDPQANQHLTRAYRTPWYI